MRALIILVLGLAAASVNVAGNRIIGGSVTSIQAYPYSVALLRSFTGSAPFTQACGGSILNNRSVFSAAHCMDQQRNANQWRMRAGSTYHNSGGIIFNVLSIIRHGSYSPSTLNNDIVILRIIGTFSFNNNVGPGSIAGSNYIVPDNAAVWAIGWGDIRVGGPGSVQLRHVQVWAINQALCRNRYAAAGHTVNDNMWCTGHMNVGGRDACQGDSGGPVLHNNVIAGLTSWGVSCADPHFPGVNVRVSRYTTWIRNNI